MLIEPLEITTPFAGFNGGVLATPELSVIEQHLLSPEIARRAVDLISAHGAQVWVFSGQDWLVRDPGGPYIGLEERTVQFPPIVVEDFGRALDIASKIVGVSDDFALLARCEGEAERCSRTELRSRARSATTSTSLTRLPTRVAAVLALSKLLAIPMAEIAVIGDGGNDVAMFEQSSFSIAMGNASPDVQKQARYVTASNEDDGFAKSVERYVLGVGTGMSSEPSRRSTRART